MLRATGFLLILFTSFIIANAQVSVTGTLVGHDGKPMAAANVVLTRPMDNTPVKIVEADADGKYTITVDSAGIWMLMFTGANHSSRQVALYADKPEKMNIDVRLKTYDYKDSLSDVKIEGGFNNFNMQTALPMQKQPDGTYIAEFETKADSFAYEIVGVEKNGRTINGTQSERYAYDGDGDYRSVVTPTNGKVRIILDPSKFMKSEVPANATFVNPNSFEAKFAGIYDESQHYQEMWLSARAEYTKSGNDPMTFKYDWSKATEGLQQQVNNETNGVLRQELFLSYLRLATLGADVYTTVVMAALKEDSAASEIWSLSPYLYTLALRRVGMQGAEYDAHIKDFMEKNPDSWAKSMILFDQFVSAKYMSDAEKATEYYDMLVNQYGNTMYGKLAKDRYSPVSKVKVGSAVPVFSVVSLDDSTKIISDESLRGKYYLMDFWATWCGPCVEEMRSLHNAYLRFKDKNFVILSISLDTAPQDVVKFRKDKWPMPWLHAFAEKGWDNKTVKDFEVVGIPRPVLVDTTGTVVAMEADLRGENLEKTLEKYLGK